MYFRYLRRELRRRARSALLVATGLALGVGLVITVTAAAAGVRTAQNQVLHSLYGVGTDITVTQTAAPGTGGPFQFGGAAPSRGQPGQSFTQDRLASPGGLATLKSADVGAVSRLQGVAGAAGVLNLNSIHITGTVGGTGSGSALGPANGFRISSFTVGGVDPTTPGLGPLAAVDVTSGAQQVSAWFKRVESGSAASDQLVALVDRSYAKQNSIAVGSSVTISGTSFKVLGLVSLAQAASVDDVYIPLSEAQTLAGDLGRVNTLVVKATSAADISRVQTEIQRLLPKATVTTAQNLATQVTGSLSTAAGLAGSLGFWLASLVLLAAFALAALLTTASVNRRVREFGTLKAMGWHSRRIVGQVIGESLVQGLVGGALGIGVGVLGAFLVTKIAPPLKATVGAP